MKIAARYQETKSEKDLQALKIANEKWMGKANFMKPMRGEGGYLSDLEKGDVEYYNKQGKEVSLKKFNDVVKSGMILLNDDIEELKKQYNNVSYRKPIVSNENQSYGGIKALMVQQGSLTDDFKGTITIEPILNDKGKETGDVRLVAVEKVKNQPVTREATVKKTSLDQTGFKLESVQRKPYDASYGENARKIQLGRATPQDNPNDYLIQNLKPIIGQAEAVGVGKEVKGLLSQYYNGQIDFSIEADQGLYKMVARDNAGNILPGSYPIDQTALDYKDVDYIYDNIEEFQSQAMQVVLQSYMNKAAVNKQLSAQSEDINNLLK
jgi:hypothetical protein